MHDFTFAPYSMVLRVYSDDPAQCDPPVKTSPTHVSKVILFPLRSTHSGCRIATSLKFFKIPVKIYAKPRIMH